MKLIERTNCGQGVHRSGWPVVLDAIRPYADGRGLLLDDCPEQSFLFGQYQHRKPHHEPWLGIFHFPHNTVSPYPNDRLLNSAMTLCNNILFDASRKTLRGVIALCDSLAAWWVRELKVPSIVLKHPTETDVPQWSYEEFAKRPAMIQLGFHLRNTRAIFHQQPIPGWKYFRTAFYQDYQRNRDAEIAKALGPGCNDQVVDIPRLDNDDYDSAMSSSVVLSHAFGVAACNVIVEAIARGTPVIVERRPETEEYVGEDYCLFLNEFDFLDRNTLETASAQLIARRGDWINPNYFAAQVASFCATLENHP